ncbi:MAG: ASKHA domain-containing protein [Clostridia bacterium]|nr:ASKHA domain-containing protein [Clostridia bacterium]
MEQVTITFQPMDVKLSVPKGSAISEAAVFAGTELELLCGGRGTCGKCRVQLQGRGGQLSQAEKDLLTADEIAAGWRLACQTRVEGDVTVFLPKKNADQLNKGALGLKGYGSRVDRSLNPLVKKVCVQIPKPDLINQKSSWDRLVLVLEKQGYQDLHPSDAGLSLLRQLEDLLSAADGQVTAVVAGKQVVAVEPGNTEEKCFGLALDIGTTTVAGALYDLRTGELKATASSANPQRVYGADVISRLDFARSDPQNTAILQEKVISVVNDIIVKCSQDSKLGPQQIYLVTVVGNTCMQHLFLGINPRNLAAAPFTAVVSHSLLLPASALRLKINPAGYILTLPNVKSYLGADTVGVILATGLHNSKKTQLAIDIGTNGEIVLSYRGRLLACTTAAGPAFEGASISCGMRAAEGAIDKVNITDKVILSVLGNGPPEGICGSGLIDAVAQMLRVGLIDSSGYLLNGDEARRVVGPELAEHLREVEGETHFILGYNHPGRPVYLSQADIRQVQLAKGAIAAGINLLLKELNLTKEDLDEILLAGAFGSYIDRNSARSIGLIPWVSLARIISVGNAAQVGAVEVLLNQDLRHESERIVKQVEYVELSGRGDFQEFFVEAMYFPNNGALNDLIRIK